METIKILWIRIDVNEQQDKNWIWKCLKKKLKERNMHTKKNNYN